jgi:type II secretory pathway pseudopilin PulG
LLVVIAIVALLMALLLPLLGRARKQAQAMVCQSRLRQWGMALAAYTEGNQGRLPATLTGVDGIWLLRGAFIGGKDPNGPRDSFHHFHTKDIACCPMATQPNGNGQFGATGGNSFGSSSSYRVRIQGTIGSVFGAWEITTPAPAFRGSYGLNQWLFQSFHRNPFAVPLSPNRCFDLDVLSLRGRAAIPVLLDAVAPWSDPDDTDPPAPSPEGLSLVGMQNFCLNRHDGCVNGLFLDWSVRKVGLKELWTLEWYTEFNRSGRWTKVGGAKSGAWPQWMRGLRDY